MDANDVKDNKKQMVFLSVLGVSTYTLLRDLVAPADPCQVEFNNLIRVLKAHFEPQPIVIAKQYNLHCTNQLPGESVAKYVARLRKLSKHCQFSAFLEEALYNQLVCDL
jgi:hypothetical protein